MITDHLYRSLQRPPEELKKVGFADVIIEEQGRSFEETSSQVKLEIKAFLLESKNISMRELQGKRMRRHCEGEHFDY